MALRAVIFDLDLTLIASGAAEKHRKARQWPAVYAMVPDLKPYEGIGEILAFLAAHKIKMAVVTSSPRPYCTRVIDHWEWAFDATVCFHDTAQRKPHPAPILKALQDLAVRADEAVAVGDAAHDILSAKAAGVLAIAATWGALDPDGLAAAKPDHSCASIDELATYIQSRIVGGS